ncbi:uncharacterized protein STEHIDRAFT_168002 [Stereum hirsutum FP-91666 SS1]|uniref:uncharacterized protein n=1 Tax=Stereum hirsutum (strain FP-91666) TaxID=721885 RepID=UPI000440DD67|nr:uncharacterized protein STEHIDRAFT_168002 [Stereum hirsutum FP-91666 SS1]EIM87170.1 hypothetical protein STEHIDRAFT_168002 [Stereum hirsutum FP-91666 SS1]
MSRSTSPRTGDHTGIPTPQSDPQAAPGTRIARNNFERALLKLPQKYIPDSAFASDAELDRINRVSGIPEDQLAAARKHYHEQCDIMFPTQTIRTMGFKPSKGERVRLFEIPDSDLSIRLWDGGLEAQGQYFLDFINTQSGLAQNSPHDWVLYSQYPDNGPFYNDRLKSWEEAWGFSKEKILPGEEKFSIGQGAWCGLERPGVDEVFWFAIPGRRLPHATTGPRVMVDQGKEGVAQG